MQYARRRVQVYSRPLHYRVVPLFIALLTGAGSLSAQATSSLLGASVPGRFSFCDPVQLKMTPELTFRQQACWHASDLMSPWAAVRAGFGVGLGQWINHHDQSFDADDYAHRVAVHYVRRGARETGEWIAEYLHHEDPRFHPSGQAGFKSRLGSSLMTVLVTKNDEGERPALAPIAGALASGLAGSALYRTDTKPAYALRGAAVCYAGYFGKAVYQEFRPDLTLFVKGMLHRRPD